MKKVLAIGGSNSSNSLNKTLANYIAGQLKDVEIINLDWNDFELPLYSADLEQQNGVHENAIKFKTLIEYTDVIVLSLAEHNGLPSAAFKNLWDWTSRIDKKFWSYKPLFLAATSTGVGGGVNVLKVVKEMIPHFGGNVIEYFSLPSFYKNFSEGKIMDVDKQSELDQKIQVFQDSI